MIDKAIKALLADTPIYLLDQMPLVSYFRPPIKNTKPEKDITLKQVHKLITGSNQLLQLTEQARETPQDLVYIKTNKLPYVTFGGRFTKRANEHLTEKSGYYCFDLDHLENIEAERDKILSIKDDYITTNLLFTSPSGEGLKWVVSIEPNGHEYKQNYEWLSKYLGATYSLKLDTTSDVARACFLCHDLKAYCQP